MATDSTIRNNLRFDYDHHAWCVLVGFEVGRLEFMFRNQSFDSEMNRLLTKTANDIIANIKAILASKGITLNDQAESFQELSQPLVRDLELLSGRVFSFFMIGMACERITMADAGGGKHHDEMLALAKSCIDSIPIQYLQDKDKFFEQLLTGDFSKTVRITDYLTTLNHESEDVDRSVVAELQQSTRKEQIQRLITQYKENYYELEMQKAKYGVDAPLFVLNAMKDAEAEIARLEEELQGLS